LSYMSDDHDGNRKIQAVIKSGCIPLVVQLLLHKNPTVKVPALRTAGNIVTGDDHQTQAVLDASILPNLLTLLKHPKKALRKEAAWTISNITAGTPDQIELVLRANVISDLLNLLRNGEFDLQKEAAWAISNATSGGKDVHVAYMVEQGVISPMCELFTVSDSKIVMVALEAIENVLKVGKTMSPRWGGTNKYCDFLEECGGLDKLEDLQRHENEAVYDKVMKILKNYFQDEADDESLAPVQTETAFQFGAVVPANAVFKSDACTAPPTPTPPRCSSFAVLNCFCELLLQ